MKKKTRWILLFGVAAMLLSCKNPYVCRETTGGKSEAYQDVKVKNKISTGDYEAQANNKKKVTASNTMQSKHELWLETRGNKIVHSDGRLFTGRGANIHDTRSCNACTWSKPNVEEVKRRIDVLVDEWGANFVRLLIESYPTADSRTHFRNILSSPDYLLDLKEIVNHIGTKKNVYVLLSLWMDPSINSKGWPTSRTIPVWEKLTETFVNTPYVMFGVVNEPHGNWNGADDANVWKAMNKLVDAIRKTEARFHDKKHLIAVQGTRQWARYLEYYVEHPITAGGGENIVYETHPYMPAAQFEKSWLKPSEHLPVIVGEFGPADGGEAMTIEDTIALMNEAEKRKIPWLAWTFHMRCPPNLLVDNSKGGCGIGMDLVPTEWGELIKERLSGEK